eukprot:1345938-Amorphochlora_amoeboformis.AAC.2
MPHANQPLLHAPRPRVRLFKGVGVDSCEESGGERRAWGLDSQLRVRLVGYTKPDEKVAYPDGFGMCGFGRHASSTRSQCINEGGGRGFHFGSAYGKGRG